MRVWPKDEDDDDYAGDGDYGDFGDDDLGACTVQAGVAYIREGFKNPRPGNFPLGGYPPPPPPRGLHGRDFSEKLTEIP